MDWTIALDAGVLLVSALAIAISVYTLNKQSSSEKFNGTRDFNALWQVFNQVLSDTEEFVKFERELHPYGDLSREDVLRMYFYFMRFNTVYASTRNPDQLEGPLAMSALNTEANISYRDRQFVRDHVFGRGYDVAFSQKIEMLWATIQKTGKTLPMHGDEITERFVREISANKNKLL